MLKKRICEATLWTLKKSTLFINLLEIAMVSRSRSAGSCNEKALINPFLE